MTKEFYRWADKNGIRNADLAAALDEIERGLVDADLGAFLIKKRISLRGWGKRGGARVILCCKLGDRAIFVHGFAKNEKSDLSRREFAAFRKLAAVLIEMERTKLDCALAQGVFVEV